ncbi:MAG: c-type cytochrome [Bosea sp.]|uniref:c-type cytochrome n=1 Tax=Bosea sp. (in: a-proteobacteria) TaxID=1871050 RepID=UPI001AC86264|nr:c-type cytochrome [Bosea sp. (in: a-proteobacteria)]
MGHLRSFVAGAVFCFVPACLSAQQLGDPIRGLAFAREVCAACHAVEHRQPASPDPHAPRFDAIASTNGMTAMALYAFLQTPHSTMPNLILTPDETANLIAYILSLKER